MQVLQLGRENFLGIAPNTQSAHTFCNGGMLRTCFANDMAVLRQTMISQSLHHLCAILGIDLYDNTQLFVEECFECQFIAARTDLLSPVFGIAMICAAV